MLGELHTCFKRSHFWFGPSKTPCLKNLIIYGYMDNIIQESGPLQGWLLDRQTQLGESLNSLNAKGLKTIVWWRILCTNLLKNIPDIAEHILVLKIKTLIFSFAPFLSAISRYALKLLSSCSFCVAQRFDGLQPLYGPFMLYNGPYSLVKD